MGSTISFILPECPSLLGIVNPWLLTCLFGEEENILTENYFESDKLTHFTSLNWYMASMVDQLNISKLQPGGNNMNHRYGFYWSPVFDDHESPGNMLQFYY
jgi:hypothetical protein